MSREAYIRARVALMVMETFPSTIRDALISDVALRADCKLAVDSVLSFGASGVAYKRSELLAAVRRAFKERKKPVTVMDRSGEPWTITFDKRRDPQGIVLRSKRRRIINVHLALLCTSKAVRLNVFRREAERVGLPKTDQERWEAVLAIRSPDDDELDAIQNDLSTTPLAVEEVIRESFVEEHVSLAQAIPNSALYYDRLVGVCSEGDDFEGYIAAGLHQHLQGLSAWDPSRGYRQMLLLAWHPTLSSIIAAHAPQDDQVASIWNDLAKKGEILSIAASIETGFGIAESDATLRGPLGRLIAAFLSATPVANVDPYQLLSSFIMLVYGEISNTRALAAKPPCWRRLAAIAHATVMTRCASRAGKDLTHFSEWASGARLDHFLVQCLVDLREEPRWLAEYVLPKQLASELQGRVWSAAQNKAALVEKWRWKAVLLADKPGSLRGRINFAQICLPGPLEGNSKPLVEIPDSNLAAMRASFADPTPKVEAFSALANMGAIFRIPNDLLDLAAEALDRTNYYLCPVDSEQLGPLLIGLASVAAATRNQKLADALCTLLRNYRRFHPTELDVDAVFEVGLVACASRAAFADWCGCIGVFMTDLAFQQFTREEAVRLHSKVLVLCNLVPELWASCGQAEAALWSLV